MFPVIYFRAYAHNRLLSDIYFRIFGQKLMPVKSLHLPNVLFQKIRF